MAIAPSALYLLASPSTPDDVREQFIGCHGRHRTNADKRRAVETLLKDPEWGKWSDREIARRCAVTQPFVSSLRSSLITVISEPPDRTYTTKHGTTATMKTERIGSSRTASPPPATENSAAD